MIVTLGEILAEILATRRGQSFLEPGTLIGPYPSGAPAIFIDQIARLGQACAMIGCVGADDFGTLNVERLRTDGVDVSAIEVHPDVPTGTAFVTYQENGERHFVFNIRHSASGHLKLGPPARSMIEHCDHLHVMGSSLFTPGLVEATRIAVERVKQRGGSISFDPNIRSELSKGSTLAEFFDFVLDNCDILLPSGSELQLLTSVDDERSAIAALLGRGIAAIVVKAGAEGARYYDRDSSMVSPAFHVEEVDPTGAGDCFGATFIVCRLLGKDVVESLRYANAAGARAVMVRGPMEGVSTFCELDAFMAGQVRR